MVEQEFKLKKKSYIVAVVIALVLCFIGIILAFLGMMGINLVGGFTGLMLPSFFIIPGAIINIVVVVLARREMKKE